MGSRFIHQNKGWPLGQSPGNGYLLPLATGNLAVGAVCQFFDTHALDSFHGDIVMLLLGPGQGSHMGRTAGNYIFQDRKVEAGNNDLGHITDDLGNLSGRDLFDVLIIDENLAFVKRNQIGKTV